MERNVLVALDDPRLKDISEAVSNKSCNKILEFLISREEGATVSEIANELGMPLNTADYNVKKLLKAGLIVKSGHWWSVKGKKMPSYKISNKRIVIVPTKKSSQVFKTAGLLAFASGLAAIVIRYFQRPFQEMSLDSVAREGAVGLAKESVSSATGLPGWEWFLIGAWSVVFLFFVVSLIRNKKGS